MAGLELPAYTNRLNGAVVGGDRVVEGDLILRQAYVFAEVVIGVGAFLSFWEKVR